MQTVFKFMEEIIFLMTETGRSRTSETYATTLRSFERFRKGRDLTFERMDTQTMAAYEAFLRSTGVCPNSSSFYMRVLRATYNRAVDLGLTDQKFPFRHVYTGVSKTFKRAVPLEAIRSIKNLCLPAGSSIEMARDMFMFSFYTRGMSLVDMAYLRKKDLRNGQLCYFRRKTGQKLFVKWEKCMQEIVSRHDTGDSPYMLPLIDCEDAMLARKQYLDAGHRINRNLKAIGRRIGLTAPLTMYVARHSWASIARNRNVPLSIISEGMGHNSESTTRIYLASLDNVAVDKANKMIIRLL